MIDMRIGCLGILIISAVVASIARSFGAGLLLSVLFGLTVFAVYCIGMFFLMVREARRISRLPFAELAVDGETARYFYEIVKHKEETTYKGIPVKWGNMDLTHTHPQQMVFDRPTNTEPTIQATLKLEEQSFTFLMAKDILSTPVVGHYTTRYFGIILEGDENEMWAGVIEYRIHDRTTKVRRPKERREWDWGWSPWRTPLPA